jgi:DNA-binding transcriptional LysR family regulator
MDRFAELKTFCLVASSGGFSSAARQLGIATSSVTRLVDSLEARLGVPLLNRSTRSVTLTDAGRQYVERATAILRELDEADDAAGAGTDEPRGLLRVAAPVTFSTLYLAPLLPEIARRYPLLELELHLSDAVSKLADESIDVAIRIGAPEHHPLLVAKKLADQQRYICASGDYLRRRGVPQTAADLAQHNCLQFAYNAGRQSWRLESDQGIEEVVVHGTLSVNNSDVLRQAAIGGVGLALLPDWLIHRELASGLLERVLAQYRVNPGAMDIGIHAVYAANRRGSVKVMAFIAMLAQALQA